MNPIALGYIRLARPANLPTAAADILAGMAIGGIFQSVPEHDLLGSSVLVDGLLLVLASVFLYAGGVILNDVFDFKIDVIERPERPIPSGTISLNSAAIYGATTMLVGIVLAFFVSNLSGCIAALLALAIILYDAVAKKNDFFGPLNMGLCRGLNLVLGISVLGNLSYWWMAIIPIVYIFAITLISRGEVHGRNRNHIVLAGMLYLTVILMVVAVAFLYTDNVLTSLVYLILFGIFVFRPLLNAYTQNSPENIKKAVMAGVIALIVLDASMAASFSNWWYGLVLMVLLPISIGLSKLFAVT